MRRFVFVCTAVVSLVGLISAASASQSVKISDQPTNVLVTDLAEEGVLLDIDISDLQLTEVTTSAGPFTLVSFTGCTRSYNIGEPNLPMVRRLLSIPFGCELSVEIIAADVTEVSLTDLNVLPPLLPAQPSISKSDDPASIPFEYNPNVYQAGGYYALPLAEAEVVGTMRSEHLGRVAIAPVEYNPTENMLRVFHHVTVKVTYQHPDWVTTDQMKERHYSPFFDPAFSRIANYAQQASKNRDDLVKHPVKYVIVSDRMFESQLPPFIEWKTQKGFEIILAYTDVIGSTTNAIRDYLDSLYSAATPQDPSPSFVLFVGDAQQIPPHDYGAHISDLYLCEFTGDNLPEIYYGRFSAQEPADLQPQIDKTLEYEQYTMPDPSYLAEVTLIAGVDATYASTYGNGQINYGTNLYFNAAHGIDPHVWLYPASSDPGASAAIIQTVDDGLGLINYTAHCGHTGFSNPSFYTSDIETLTNAHKYLLGIGNCCLSNTFGTDYSTPCFGEVWLQSENKGGVGYIGGSNSTYWDEDYWWGVGYGPVTGSGPSYEQTGLGAYDGLFHDHGEPVTQHYVTNDAIIYCGNLAVTESGSSRIAYYWQIYHLMGDPSVMTYLGVPTLNTVTHPSAMLLTATSVSVQADPGSHVGISRDGVLHGAAHVDETGSVEVPITPFSVPGLADVVVTAQNRQPYMATIQIITPEGPYVVYDSAVVDDAGGNGNGLVDAGESILLGIRLKNVGPDTAYNVEATLTTTDSQVTVTDATESYGTIPGENGTAYVAAAFALDIASNAPDRHSISLRLEVSGTNRDTWIGNFNLPVHAPVVGITSVAVNDAAGNNNGILDPGETAELVVTLGNTGSGQGNNLEAVLTESDSYVTVVDDYGYFGGIDSINGSASNTADVYLVAADSSCPMGHSVDFSLAVTGDLGFNETLPFDAIVGDREGIFVDDFSTDQGWVGLGGSGEWTIGPATGGGGADSYGGPDPAIDHSPTEDNGVLGNDLNPGSGGDYNSSLGTTYWVTSPLIDCSNHAAIQLLFYRWLGVEQPAYDHALLQVNDGSGWVTLFENGATMDESSWSEQLYDVSAYADGNPDFQIRFGIGPTDGGWQYCGWNIDDLALKGYSQGGGAALLAFLQSQLADSLVEGDSTQLYLRVYNTGDGELRIRFTPTEPWMICSSDRQTIAPGDSLEFAVSLFGAGLAPGDHNGVLQYTSNDAGHSSGEVPVLLHIHVPECDIPMSSISDTLEPGQETVVPLTINNTGPGRLTYAVGCQMFDKSGGPLAAGQGDSPPMPIGERPADIGKSEAIEPYFAPATKGSGGPDSFGYTWIDSDEPAGPDWEWVNIAGVGTHVSLGDDAYVGPIPIGFVFPFYDSTYTELYIGSNGLLTFGSGSSPRQNTYIPNPSAPNGLIAMWWDDLDPSSGGNVYYHYDSSQERFTVSFMAVPNYLLGEGTGSLTFQAILRPSGRITLNYGNMDPGGDVDGLTGATVGIERPDAGDGLQVVYNASYMHDMLTIVFRRERWLSVVPASGQIEPYSSSIIDVHLNGTELGVGSYAGEIGIATNDPNLPSTTLPVSLMVQQDEPYVCGDVNGSSEPPNVADVTYLVDYLFNSGPPPPLMEAANVDAQSGVDVADLTRLVDYLFNGGQEPVCAPLQ